MADLSRETGAVDRGQLILVTAFALAAIFLGLAIIVNSAIFTENLATRSENVESTEALEYRHEVTQFTGNLVEFANENNNSDEESIWRNVNDGIQDLNDYSGIQQAKSGEAIALSLDSSTNGSRIFQSSNTNFTSNASNSTWTLATNVERTRGLEINASDFPGSGDGFRIVANDTTDPSADEWTVTINGTTVVVNRDDVGERNCAVDTVETVDVTGATVNGEPCPALQDTETGEELFFAAGITDDYEIRFENGSRIEGNYSLVVGNDASFPVNYTSPGGPGDGPRRTAAMYSATVRLEYETPDLKYETDVRIAPGEAR